MRHPHSLSYLRAFEAVARLGSVRSAAGEMNVTPGAVSQQIRNLQDTLSLELFSREGRRLRLTDAGHTLRRSTAGAFADISASLDEIAARSIDPPTRTLSVAAPPALAVSWLTAPLFEFADALGLTSIRMSPAIEVNDVDWRHTDVAIIYGVPPWRGFSWRLMANVVLRPVCSPRLLNGALPLRSESDIADQWLLHEDGGAEWTRWMSAANVRQVPGRNAYFGTLVMALAAALDGRGLALVSDFLAQDHLANGRLVRPFETGIEASKSYYCVYADRRLDEPLIQRFCQGLIDRIGSPRFL